MASPMAVAASFRGPRSLSMPAFRHYSDISHMRRAAWAPIRVMSSTGKDRPPDIRSIPITKSLTPLLFQPCCRDFGPRAVVGRMHGPAVFEQQLMVRPNRWFGVTSVREVTVVWFYLAFVTEWEALFADNSLFEMIIEGERMTNRLSQLQHAGHKSDRHTNQLYLADLTAWSAAKAEERLVSFRLFSNSEWLLLPRSGSDKFHL